jgi:predicted N-acetyltransferase YhbS
VPGGPWLTALIVPMSPTWLSTPDHQGRGLGKAILRQLVALSQGHKKIILYANPGTEGFYGKLGFLRMNTAMAIWRDPAHAIESGVLSAQP